LVMDNHYVALSWSGENISLLWRCGIPLVVIQLKRVANPSARG